MVLIEPTVGQSESAPSKKQLKFYSRLLSLARKILFQEFQKTSFLANLHPTELGIAT